MAKRRAEDTLLRGSPSKRCFRSLGAADLPLERMAPTGGESPPSLLAPMGGRKRPRHFEDSQKQEDCSPLSREPANCDTRKHGDNALLQQTRGGFRGPRSSSALTSSKKRPRDDSAGSETVIPKANDKAGEDNDTEDCSYNSFQYWKLPLPELNLSLLKDDNHSKSKEEPTVKDFAPDAMET